MKSTAKALVTLILLAFALPAFAAVNINTADVAELDTLPGIGPAKAQAIIDYRTQNGPFETKEELLTVDGIGQATYDGLKDLIVIDGGGSNTTNTTDTADDTDDSTSSTTQTQTSTNTGGSSTKGAPLKTVTITHDTVVAQAPTTFRSTVTDTKGSTLTYGVRYWWNFGDGTTGVGAAPVHTYEHPGTYTVGLRVTHKELDASTEVAVAVLASGITLSAPGDGSVALTNTTDASIDIGGWLLTDTQTVFTIPAGTRLAKKSEARFAHNTTGIYGTPQTILLFPNGVLAAAVASSKPTGSGYGDFPAEKLPEVLSSSLQKPPLPVVSTSQDTSVTVHAGSQQAAVATTPLSQQALPWAGLAGVLALGSVGTYLYARRSVTKPAAQEFDIV